MIYIIQIGDYDYDKISLATTDLSLALDNLLDMQDIISSNGGWKSICCWEDNKKLLALSWSGRAKNQIEVYDMLIQNLDKYNNVSIANDICEYISKCKTDMVNMMEMQNLIIKSEREKRKIQREITLLNALKEKYKDI